MTREDFMALFECNFIKCDSVEDFYALGKNMIDLIYDDFENRKCINYQFCVDSNIDDGYFYCDNIEKYVISNWNCADYKEKTERIKDEN